MVYFHMHDTQTKSLKCTEFLIPSKVITHMRCGPLLTRKSTVFGNEKILNCTFSIITSIPCFLKYFLWNAVYMLWQTLPKMCIYQVSLLLLTNMYKEFLNKSKGSLRFNSETFQLSTIHWCKIRLFWMVNAISMQQKYCLSQNCPLNHLNRILKVRRLYIPAKGNGIMLAPWLPIVVQKLP